MNVTLRCQLSLKPWRKHVPSSDKRNQSGSSETHKLGNIDIIANFEFPYISSFLLYFHCMMLVDVKLDVSEGYRLYWSSSLQWQS